MRSLPPHPIVRFRLALLFAALAAWAVAFAVLILFKDNPSVPVAAIFAAAAIVFVWANGAFWWLELCYPHMEIAPGQFVSRAERASGFMHSYSKTFFGIYGFVSVFITIACVRVASDA